MSEMIERVRDEILRVNATTEGLPFSKLVEEMARAAIAAMREPTTAMLSACIKARVKTGDPDQLGFSPAREWRAMIDKALES